MFFVNRLGLFGVVELLGCYSVHDILVFIEELAVILLESW